MNEKIPKAIWEGKVSICGITLRCYVLDDHRRIFNADDVAKFFQVIGDGGLMPTEQEAMKLVKWIKSDEIL